MTGSNAEEGDAEQTLQELHRRYETLEGAVEAAVNDLRAHSRPGTSVWRVADGLELALKEEGRYADPDVDGMEVDR